MVKRLTLLLLAVLILVIAACGPSPKARTKEFARYLPARVGDWKQNEKETVELLASTVTSLGHITLQYEGADDALAYVVIETHPSEDAAQVAITSRERELRMLGLEFTADRKPKQVTAQIAQSGRATYALMQEGNVAVEIDVLAGSADTPVSEDALGQLLTIVRAAYAKLAEE